MDYHAHIYWNNEEEKEKALGLRIFLHDNGCSLGRIRDRAVGPHPLPMYQAGYNEKIRVCIEEYLYSSNGGLSILLHENEGEDELRDHTTGARWIGHELELDLSFFQEQ